MTHFYPSILAFASCLFATSSIAQVDNCEPIRSQIEAKIKASGVIGFTVTVAETTATFAGKTVGSCANGSKKIVYLANQKPSGIVVPIQTTSAAAAQPMKKKASPILTECKDGSTSVGGDCK